MDEISEITQSDTVDEVSIPAASTENCATPGEKTRGRGKPGDGEGAGRNKRHRPGYHLARYHRLRAEAIAAKGGKCARCGSEDRLEFDHVERSTKSFTVSMLWGASKERMAAELAKCQLLCRPCHEAKTSDEARARRRHGTWVMYQRHRCRCDECRRFVSDQRDAKRRARYAALVAATDRLSEALPEQPPASLDDIRAWLAPRRPAGAPP